MEQMDTNQENSVLNEGGTKKGYPVVLFVLLLVVLGVVLGVITMKKPATSELTKQEVSDQITKQNEEAEKIKIGREKESILMLVNSPGPLNPNEKQELFKLVGGNNILKYDFTSEEQVTIFNAFIKE